KSEGRRQKEKPGCRVPAFRFPLPSEPEHPARPAFCPRPSATSGRIESACRSHDPRRRTDKRRAGSPQLAKLQYRMRRDIPGGSNNMRIGVPTEIKDNEYRVGMTPAGVAILTADGHQVYVQSGA